MPNDLDKLNEKIDRLAKIVATLADELYDMDKCTCESYVSYNVTCTVHDLIEQLKWDLWDHD